MQTDSDSLDLQVTIHRGTATSIASLSMLTQLTALSLATTFPGSIDSTCWNGLSALKGLHTAEVCYSFAREWYMMWKSLLQTCVQSLQSHGQLHVDHDGSNCYICYIKVHVLYHVSSIGAVGSCMRMVFSRRLLPSHAGCKYVAIVKSSAVLVVRA